MDTVFRLNVYRSFIRRGSSTNFTVHDELPMLFVTTRREANALYRDVVTGLANGLHVAVISPAGRPQQRLGWYRNILACLADEEEKRE